ncbi:MAG: hypothetical protein HKN26_09525 [Acidimicrobiales bacterium]|nr:hypothetical protein [Acidimicrobiales bacterium]
MSMPWLLFRRRARAGSTFSGGRERVPIGVRYYPICVDERGRRTKLNGFFCADERDSQSLQRRLQRHVDGRATPSERVVVWPEV